MTSSNQEASRTKPLLFPEYLNWLHPGLHEHAAKNPSLRLTWKTRELLPVDKVLHGHLDLFEVIQNVKLRQVDRVIAVDQTRMFHHDEVKPATTPATTRRGTILMPDLLEMNSYLLWLHYTSASRPRGLGGTHIELFSRERAAPNTGRVCLDNADNLSNATWRDTEACADPTHGCGAARHVRIRTIVNVEHQRISAFDENTPASCECLVNVHNAVDDERAQPLRQSLQ